MNKHRIAAAAVLLIALVIVSGIQLADFHGGQVRGTVNSPIPGSTQPAAGGYDGFSFPYFYSAPNVPSSVGAQGIQGPNLPASSLGPQGIVGTSGHIGPVNYTGPVTWNPASDAVYVQVYYGIVSARSPASGVRVALLNVTNGNTVAVSTDTSGVATMTVPQGWYYLQIDASNSSYSGFAQLVNLEGSSTTLSRYLIPSSLGVVSVSNGGSSTADIYMEQPTSAYGTGSYTHMPQMEVRLLYASNHTVAATAYALSNGTVGFTGVNTAYQYAFEFAGYMNDVTGVVYDVANFTEPFTVSGSVYVDTAPLNLGGLTTSTGSISGTPITSPFAPNGSSWTLGADTVVSGGVTYISQKLALGSYSLKFVNALVYFNESQTGSGGGSGLNLYFVNSTVVVLTNLGNLLGDPNSVHQTAIHFDHSILYAAGMQVPLSGEPVSLMSDHVTNSVVMGYVTLGGSFYNDRFLRVQTGSQISVSNSYVLSSTISQSPQFTTAASQMTVYSSDRVTDNSSTSIRSSLGYFNNSNISYTIPPNTRAFVDFASGLLFMVNDYLSFAAPPNMSISSYLGTVTTTNFNTGTLNLSKSLLFLNQAPRYPSVNLFTGSSYVNLYDDYVNENYTLNQLVNQWDYHVINSQLGDTPLYMNYTTLVTGGLFNFEGNNMTLSHDMFTGLNEVNADTIQNQIFPSMSHRGPFSVIYSNDTWGSVYVNYTLTSQITPHTYLGVGQFIEDMNVRSPPSSAGPAYLTVTHNTFLPFFAGSATFASSTAPAEVLLGEGGPTNVIANISGNVFANNYSYTTGPDRFSSTPYYWDIVIFGGTGVIYNNYFLNLNQQVIPIGGNNNESGTQGWSGRYSLISNHLYYSPAHGQTSVPTFTDLTHETTSTGLSAISYQIPVYYNSTLTNVAGGTYIFNTSIFASPIPLYSGRGAWVWNVSPDVQIRNGFPMVSFRNGYEGGLQPNFTWNGSVYHIAVEPNMTYISTGNPSAGKVGLQFQVPAGFRMIMVWMHDPTTSQNQLLATANESTVARTVTVNYDPSTMPASAVFFANETSGYNLTFLQTGIPAGVEWSVTVNGIQQNSTSGQLVFKVVNGQYSYRYNEVPGYSPIGNATGSISVNGSDESVGLSWLQNIYSLTFHRSGIPPGTAWSVTVGTLTVSATNTSLTFMVANGTYTFSVGAVSGYMVDVASNTVHISGANQTVLIQFLRANYTVTFDETGLASESWSVTLSNVTLSTHGTSITFSVTNGTYGYNISVPSGYSADVVAGTVTIQGSSLHQPIVFSALNTRGNKTTTQKPPAPTTISLLKSPYDIYLMIAIAGPTIMFVVPYAFSSGRQVPRVKGHRKDKKR